MTNFCVMPWYNSEVELDTSHESVCCWLSRPVDREQLQQQFQSQARPDVCKKCWDSEDQGVESRRQMENRFLDHKLNRDIELIQQDAYQGKSQVVMYQIDLGSLCNGTCVTCGPSASSAWKQLENKSISIRQENQHVDQFFTNLKDQIKWSAVKRINLLGGEPLLIKKSFEILHLLRSAGNTDCRISFVTNGSVRLSQDQIDLFREFTDISCCVSIDGTGPTFEYIRYPLSWIDTLHNITQYKEIFAEVTVSLTVSNLNYHERLDIIQWLQQNDLLYIENYVTYPAWFNYQVMPGHALWPAFVRDIRRQDSLKGIDIANYIPRLSQIILEHT